jgi:hypothetical protein
VGDDSHVVFRKKLLGEDGSVRRGVVMVKQTGLFSPNFGATSLRVFTQSPQNVAVESGIHSLACWDRCFALPQLLYRGRHQSGIFWIPPRVFEKITSYNFIKTHFISNTKNTSFPMFEEIVTLYFDVIRHMQFHCEDKIESFCK